VEPEADSGRNRGDRCPVAVTVRHQGHPVEVGAPGQVGGPGEVPVGDDDRFESCVGQGRHTGGHGPVQARLVDLDYGRSEGRRPGGHLIVVTDHRYRQRRRRCHHRFGHSPGQGRAGVGVEHLFQPDFGVGERLHGDQYGDRCGHRGGV
ncbi:uncharacterized protein METZ01_LOCUS114807, partial [marine metagenome]